MLTITLMTSFQLVVPLSLAPHSTFVLIALGEICGQALVFSVLCFQSVRSWGNTEGLLRRWKKEVGSWAQREYGAWRSRAREARGEACSQEQQGRLFLGVFWGRGKTPERMAEHDTQAAL